MAKNKIGLNFNGFEEYLEKLDRAKGCIEEGVEDALIASKQEVNKDIYKLMERENMPAAGRYYTGHTKASIDEEKKVKWQGAKASIPVGFDMKRSKSTSIYLLFGTPKQRPVAGLKDAIYGKKAKAKRGEIQREIIAQAIRMQMGG